MPKTATTTPQTNRLRELREAAGDSRVEVAHLLGLRSDMPVQRWEQRGQDIPIYHARRLAEHYKVTLSFLLCDGAEGKAA